MKCYYCGKLIPRDTEPTKTKDGISVKACNHCKKKREDKENGIKRRRNTSERN